MLVCSRLCLSCPIPTSRVTDWDSFHNVFAEALGFPDCYGRNNNAFLDLLYYPETEDLRVDVALGDSLTLYLDEPGDNFASRCPEQYAFLVRTLAIANAEGIRHGEWVTLALAYPSQE